MAAEPRRGAAGVWIGGILAVLGLILMIAWSLWIGLIVTVIGFVFFGGFLRGGL